MQVMVVQQAQAMMRPPPVFYGALKAIKAVLQLSSTISTTARLALTKWVDSEQLTNHLMVVWTSVLHEVTQVTSMWMVLKLSTLIVQKIAQRRLAAACSIMAHLV